LNNPFAKYCFTGSCRQWAGRGKFVFGFLIGRVVTETGQVTGVSHI